MVREDSNTCGRGAGTAPGWYRCLVAFSELACCVNRTLMEASMRLKSVLLLALISACGLSACGLDPEQPNDSLRITTNVSRTSFRAGDSVTIAVTATNVGYRTVRIIVNGCPSWFQVLRGTQQVFPGGEYCLTMAIMRDPRLRRIAYDHVQVERNKPIASNFTARAARRGYVYASRACSIRLARNSRQLNKHSNHSVDALRDAAAFCASD